MDAERWRDEQRDLRAAVRAARETNPDLMRTQTGTAPFVSVVVVCWNAAEVLGRCLDQLFAQDYGDYEIVVVDDGSKDATVAVAEEAATRGPLKLVRSPRNRGCPHARNLGIAHACGEIVAFIDADGFAAPDWLRLIVATFSTDPAIGGVASTVFFAANPLVINGAGGTVNRQGWAADLTMNQPYEQAEIASEALYPMGCGMAVRRKAIESVGPFDDRMLNYYDDVDYGIRLWRAGFSVAVSPDAWIDHDVGASAVRATRKQLLCERHRMRVALKHSSLPTLARWARGELATLRAATGARRLVKLKSMAWNACHARSVLVSRRVLRRAPRVPERLVDPSWGDGFPVGMPLLSRSRPEAAGQEIDMAEPASAGQLVYGWFPTERVEGRSYRWAGTRAAGLLHLERPARRLRLDYAHVPVDTGGVELTIRQLGSPDPLTPVWRTRLLWQYIARSVENHPLALEPGDYEVVFSAARGWSEPPLETRSLSLALSSIALEDSFEIPAGALDMASATVEEQLVSGWFEAEQTPTRSYRWATGHAAGVVRVAERVEGVRLSYCLPPRSIGLLKVSVSRLAGEEGTLWEAHIAWRDGDWHEESLPLKLPAGDYLVSFDAEATWSNPDQKDDALWPESRSLGFALAWLRFEERT